MKLAQRIVNLAESATLAVSAKAAQLRAEGKDVIGFGAGEPDFDTPESIKQAAIAALHDGQTKYSKPASGLLDTKKAICAKLARDNGLTYAPEHVIVTAGGKMAIYLLMHALLEAGDEIVIPKPYWVSYPEIAKLAGATPVFTVGREANDYRLTPDELAESLTDRTRMVLINSPSNPSGVTYSPDEIRGLAGVLEDRDVVVLSDEIYDQLVYDGHHALSYASVSEKTYRQTVTINGASKTFSMTGWRLGYAAGPADIIKAMAKLQSQSTSGAATFGQQALATALVSDSSEVMTMRVEFEKRARFMYQRLAAIPGIRCPKPTGAFYCFPNVSALYDKMGVTGSAAFSERLLVEANVAVVPGIAFGMDEHVRLSFAVSMDQIDQGLERIEKMLA